MQHCTFYKLDIYTFCIISETAIWIDVGSQHLKGLDVRIYIYTHSVAHTQSHNPPGGRQRCRRLCYDGDQKQRTHFTAALLLLSYTTLHGRTCVISTNEHRILVTEMFEMCVCVLQTAWICFNYIFTFYYNFGLCCSSAVEAAGAHIQVFSLIKTRGVVSNCLLQGALKTLS